MRLVSTKEIERHTCHDLSVAKNNNFFANGICVHNSNGAIVFRPNDDITFQSRSRILSLEQDNCGFMMSMLTVGKDKLKDMIPPEFSNYTELAVFGEVCGCFSYDTPILLADGTKRKIGLIVNGKEEVSVLSYNFEKNALESKKVVSWHKNGYTDDWLTIKFKRRKKGGKTTRLVVTRNHKMYKKGVNGIEEISAGALKPNDTVFIAGKRLKYQVKQFILGSFLGDGSFISDSIYATSHSEENQPFYMDFIRTLTKNYSNATRNKNVEKMTSGFGAKILKHYTASFPEIKNMHDMLFKNGKDKQPTEEYLNNLHPIALAAWYMDDGSLTPSKNNRQFQCRLHTLGFNYDTNCIIRDWFNKHGYSCYIVNLSHYKDGPKHEIRFTPEGSIAFLSTISPYIIDGFNYKLPECFHVVPKYNWDIEMGEMEQSLIETKVESVKIGSPYKEKSQKIKYDIEIEDNHNYFANNILVHNSNIQKGVALTQLPKMFVVFAVRLNGEEKGRWLKKDEVSKFHLREHRIFNIYDFQTWEVEIDFNDPKAITPILSDFTIKVEEECPVGKHFLDKALENTIYQSDDLKVWLKDESNGFSKPIIELLTPKLEEIRREMKEGTIFIKFKKV